METPENIVTLLDAQARAIAEQAQRAYEELLALIADGVNPVDAVQRVQETFNGEYKKQLQLALTEVIGRTVTAAEVAKMPISGMALSARLYRNTLQTSMEVGALVKAHAAGMHDARALAIRLYDGYNPKDGIQRPIEGRSMAKLPRPLRELLKLDPALKGSYETLLGQVQQSAAILKSAALKASYMELIDQWQKGHGYNSLKKKLDVAYREKTRFHANRIAQTELARAHQDKVGVEFMLDDTIGVVQVVMSPGHPLTDICDFHAKANLFNLGQGMYPKGKAPKPTYHPFCRCVLRSRPDITLANMRDRPGAEAAYLRTMPIPEAARIVGGRSRLQRILNGTPFDDVLNASKNPQYHLTRLGQLDLSAVHPARVPLVVALDNQPMRKHPDSLPNSENAVVAREKIFKYALDPNHSRGGDKAYVFASVLGFTLENGQDLINQILSKVAYHPSVERPSNEYGRSFRVDLPVTGPTGRGIVTTGWFIDNGTTTPRLASIRVAKKAKNAK